MTLTGTLSRRMISLSVTNSGCSSLTLLAAYCSWLRQRGLHCTQRLFVAIRRDLQTVEDDRASRAQLGLDLDAALLVILTLKLGLCQLCLEHSIAFLGELQEVARVCDLHREVMVRCLKVDHVLRRCRRRLADLASAWR